MTQPKRGGLCAGQKMRTPWDALRMFPPYYVRLLAKTGHATALNDADIAISSGIDLNRIREIKMMRNWDLVTVGELLRFTTACNFDPMRARDRDRVKKYDYTWKTRNSIPFKYLRSSPKWESEILPVLGILQQEFSSSSPRS